MGSITYSEGIHDDVNKMVWGNLDYREEAPVEEAVRDYVRFFIDPDLTDELSGLIFKLEESWTGRILENANIDALYEKMMSIDKRVSRETGKISAIRCSFCGSSVITRRNSAMPMTSSWRRKPMRHFKQKSLWMSGSKRH